MSTAGKVLSIVVALFTIVWMILAAGVAQLNTNANTTLHELEAQVEKLSVDVEAAKTDVVHLLDETGSVQEKVDRGLMVLRSRANDLEKARSQMIEMLTRAQYQIAILEQTVKDSQDTLANRNEELESEKKALADARSEVKTLIAQTSAMMTELGSLREKFQTTYGSALDQLGGKQ